MRCAKSLLIFALAVAAAARPVSGPYKGDLAIFEAPDRAEKLQIERVMDLLGIRPGSRVADIGAGSGWFTVRAARRVGDSGKVYAVEINREYLQHIRRRAADERLPNVVAILGKPDDPLLPPKRIDAVLLLKTYHEIAQPIALMRKLREALRPGGRVGIIDRNGRGDNHGLDAAIVEKELKRAGFRLVATYDFVKGEGVQYFLLFECRPGLATGRRAVFASIERSLKMYRRTLRRVGRRGLQWCSSLSLKRDP